MGTLNDAFIKGMNDALHSYKFVFGYRAEPAKGMIISKSLLPILTIRNPTRVIAVGSNDDEAVMLMLAMARKFRAISVQFGIDEESIDALAELQDLQLLGDPIRISVGISRFSMGKKTATYILRDKAARMVRSEPYGVRVFALEKPELLHGQGSGWDVRKI